MQTRSTSGAGGTVLPVSWSISWKMARPPGLRWRTNARRSAIGSGRYMRTTRPMIASNSLPKGRFSTLASTNLTLPRPRKAARSLAYATVVPDWSKPVTWPSGPTISRARKATSPAPLKVSRTRIPGSRPASRKSIPVRGSNAFAEMLGWSSSSRDRAIWLLIEPLAIL